MNHYRQSQCCLTQWLATLRVTGKETLNLCNLCPLVLWAEFPESLIPSVILDFGVKGRNTELLALLDLH